jgi:hypothetical protein
MKRFAVVLGIFPVAAAEANGQVNAEGKARNFHHLPTP